MKIALKPLDQQVMVITGASSGIGLATALAAARQGATLVLSCRSRFTLEALVEQIQQAGGHAMAVLADVGERDQVDQIAAQAVARFGRIDTWVNNAGVSIFGRADEVRDDDAERLFRTNFWGVVYGSRAALPYLRQQGGALINIGSEASEAAIPLQAIYSASKHAVKGYTDALRIELEADKAPVSVTLIQPTAVDTPFPEHAGNYLDQEPKLPTPMIEPEKVASAILEAATEPTRDVRVGAMAVVNTAMAKVMPTLADMMARMQMGRQQRNEPPRAREGTLYQAGETGLVYGRGNQNAADKDEAMALNVRPNPQTGAGIRPH
jgi:short-subunit dehydrogenase